MCVATDTLRSVTRRVCAGTGAAPSATPDACAAALLDDVELASQHALAADLDCTLASERPPAPPPLDDDDMDALARHLFGALFACECLWGPCGRPVS